MMTRHFEIFQWATLASLATFFNTGCEPFDYRNPLTQPRTTSSTATQARSAEPDSYPINLGAEKPFPKTKGKVSQKSFYPTGHTDWPETLPPTSHEESPGEEFPGSEVALPGTSLQHSCQSSDPENLCLNLKFVKYQTPRSSDQDETQIQKTIQEANAIWSTCGIEFKLDQYQTIDPVRYRLRSTTTDYQELPRIRRTFADDHHLLIVATSNWNRNGSLGNTWANAWTNLPGDSEHGAVIEHRVVNDANLIAHELGHYLSLDHASDPAELMSPLIYLTSQKLTRSQCASARWAAKNFWSKALEPVLSGDGH